MIWTILALSFSWKDDDEGTDDDDDDGDDDDDDDDDDDADDDADADAGDDDDDDDDDDDRLKRKPLFTWEDCIKGDVGELYVIRHQLDEDRSRNVGEKDSESKVFASSALTQWNKTNRAAWLL